MGKVKSVILIACTAYLFPFTSYPASPLPPSLHPSVKAIKSLATHYEGREKSIENEEGRNIQVDRGKREGGRADGCIKMKGKRQKERGRVD